MQLEDYFEFEKHQFAEVGEVPKICFKGSRIALENIIEPYLAGESPERIFHGYRHSLTLEQVYGAITYYLHNKKDVEEYLRRGNEVADFWYQQHLAKEPDEVTKRLRALKAQPQASNLPK